MTKPLLHKKSLTSREFHHF